ncbi:MAG TPA: hypothetical protein DEA38_00275 [Stenotrophomonas sp.]|nr:hypothetical protein [Stenotrophomonas sp.]
MLAKLVYDRYQDALDGIPSEEQMRASAAPETIYSEMLLELAGLYLGRQQINEFGLRQLKARAERLCAVDAISGMEVKGHIALLSGDSVTGRDLLDRVLTLAGPSAEITLRYMQGLQQRGFSSEVAEVFFRNTHVFAGNVMATREARQILASHGFLDAANDLRLELNKMNAPVAEVSYAPGEHLLAYFDGDGVADSDTAPVVGFVRNFLYEQGVILQRVGISVVPADDGMPSALLYELEVNVPAERAAELEWDLYGKLEEEQFPLELGRRILFSVTADPKST